MANTDVGMIDGPYAHRVRSEGGTAVAQMDLSLRLFDFLRRSLSSGSRYAQDSSQGHTEDRHEQWFLRLVLYPVSPFSPFLLSHTHHSRYRFFLSLLAYFVGGSYYNYSQYGSTGMDAIPHRDVWRDLPYVLADLFKGTSIPRYRTILN